jgi:hypothetical protein
MTNEDMVCWGPRAVQLASSLPHLFLWTIATYSKNKGSYKPDGFSYETKLQTNVRTFLMNYKWLIA